MIDGASRYAVFLSWEHVTNGSFGSSLPARMSSLSHWVASNCRATICTYWLVFCRHFFCWAMRSASSLRGSGGAGASAGGTSGAGAPVAGGAGLGWFDGLGAGLGLGGGVGSCGYGRG